MDYFDDLNPYLVRQQENQTEPELPPINPGAVGQSYFCLLYTSPSPRD